MLRLNVRVGTADALRTVQVIFRQASDITPVLRRWGGWLRKDAARHFEEQPGWAPLAASTQKRLQQTRTAAVTAAGKVRKSYAKRSAAAFLGRLRKQVVNSSTHLAELRRLAAGGSTSYSLQDGQRRQSVALERLRKQLAKARATGKRQGGDRRASASHKLLGKLRSSIIATAKEQSAVVESRVPWAGVHNRGGTAGRGANIPGRTFLEITDEGAAQLAEIALEHLMGKEG